MTPEEVAEGWQSSGHKMCGVKCVRTTLGVEASVNNGQIVAWLPTTVEDPFTDDNGEPAPLFKVRFESGVLTGEHEDLEMHEVLKSMPPPPAEETKQEWKTKKQKEEEEYDEDDDIVCSPVKSTKGGRPVEPKARRERQHESPLKPEVVEVFDDDDDDDAGKKDKDADEDAEVDEDEEDDEDDDEDDDDEDEEDEEAEPTKKSSPKGKKAPGKKVAGKKTKRRFKKLRTFNQPVEESTLETLSASCDAKSAKLSLWKPLNVKWEDEEEDAMLPPLSVTMLPGDEAKKMEAGSSVEMPSSGDVCFRAGGAALSLDICPHRSNDDYYVAVAVVRPSVEWASPSGSKNSAAAFAAAMCNLPVDLEAVVERTSDPQLAERVTELESFRLELKAQLALEQSQRSGSIEIWKVGKKEATLVYRAQTEDDAVVLELRWASTQKSEHQLGVLACLCEDGTLRCYSMPAPLEGSRTTRLHATWSYGMEECPSRLVCFEWSPLEPELICAGCEDGSALVWSVVDTELPLARLFGCKGGLDRASPVGMAVRSVAWNPARRRTLVTMNDSGWLQVWCLEVDTVYPAFEFRYCYYSCIRGLEWLPHGNAVLIGSANAPQIAGLDFTAKRTEVYYKHATMKDALWSLDSILVPNKSKTCVELALASAGADGRVIFGVAPSLTFRGDIRGKIVHEISILDEKEAPASSSNQIVAFAGNDDEEEARHLADSKALEAIDVALKLARAELSERMPTSLGVRYDVAGRDAAREAETDLDSVEAMIAPRGVAVRVVRLGRHAARGTLCSANELGLLRFQNIAHHLALDIGDQVEEHHKHAAPPASLVVVVVGQKRRQGSIRGRPRKTENLTPAQEAAAAARAAGEPPPPKKKRGRPLKIKPDEGEEARPLLPGEEPPPKKKKRGRPPKPKPVLLPGEEPPPKKKRGRPPKIKPSLDDLDADSDEDEGDEGRPPPPPGSPTTSAGTTTTTRGEPSLLPGEEEPPPKKKRGRPPKKKKPEEPTVDAEADVTNAPSEERTAPPPPPLGSPPPPPPKKPRGRPPKNKTPVAAEKQAASTEKKEDTGEIPPPPPGSPPPQGLLPGGEPPKKKRGRPRKVVDPNAPIVPPKKKKPKQQQQPDPPLGAPPVEPPVEPTATVTL